MCWSSGSSTASAENLAHLVNSVQDLSARGVGLRVLAGQGSTPLPQTTRWNLCLPHFTQGGIGCVGLAKEEIA